MLCSKVTPASEVLVRDLDEESVLLHLSRESYFGLDGIGTRMWKALTCAESIADARDQLLGEYDVDPKRLEADLLALVGELADAGLIEVHEA